MRTDCFGLYHYDEPTLDFNGMASEAHNWALQTLMGYWCGPDFATQFPLGAVCLHEVRRAAEFF